MNFDSVLRIIITQMLIMAKIHTLAGQLEHVFQLLVCAVDHKLTQALRVMLKIKVN